MYNITSGTVGQTTIMTNVVRQFLRMSLFLEQEKTPPAIGIATGPAGIGKTIALSCLQDTLVQERSFPQSNLLLAASPFLTPSRLKSQILQLFDASTYHACHSLSAIFRQQGIRLLSIDNADLLRKETWEMLRMLSDETSCSLLLVGHPVLHRHLEHHSYLMDRVRLIFDLHPASFDEVLHVVLPHLVGDQWAFDPENEEDRRIAEELWLRVSPSLRRLKNVLNIASALAQEQHESSITPAYLYQALQWIPGSVQIMQKKRRHGAQ